MRDPEVLMNQALAVAKGALITADVPVGAIVIDPDGVGDVVLTPNTELFVQSSAGANSTNTGAVQVWGGVGVGGGVFVGGTVTATNFVGNVTGAVTGSSSQVNTQATPNNAAYYATFVDSNNASSTAETVYTTSTVQINPGTGELKAAEVVATNGILVNSNIIGSNYTIAAGNNGLSVGPVTISSGTTVTVSNGQRWVII